MSMLSPKIGALIVVMLLAGCTNSNDNDILIQNEKQYLNQAIEANAAAMQIEQGSVNVYNSYVNQQISTDDTIRILDGYLGTAMQLDKDVKSMQVPNGSSQIYTDIHITQVRINRNLTQGLSLMKSSIITNDPNMQQESQTHISWVENNLKRSIVLIQKAVEQLPT